MGGDPQTPHERDPYLHIAVYRSQRGREGLLLGGDPGTPYERGPPTLLYRVYQSGRGGPLQ